MDPLQSCQTTKYNSTRFLFAATQLGNVYRNHFIKVQGVTHPSRWAAHCNRASPGGAPVNSTMELLGCTDQRIRMSNERYLEALNVHC